MARERQLICFSLHMGLLIYETCTFIACIPVCYYDTPSPCASGLSRFRCELQ